MFLVACWPNTALLLLWGTLMPIDAQILGSTVLQSWADLGALWGRRRGRLPRTVKLELDGDVLEIAEISPADRAKLIEAWISRQAGDEPVPASAAGPERVPGSAASSADGRSVQVRVSSIIAGEPLRLLIRLVVTIAVLTTAIIAIVAGTNTEPAWGAVGAVIGYWLR